MTETCEIWYVLDEAKYPILLLRKDGTEMIITEQEFFQRWMTNLPMEGYLVKTSTILPSADKPVVESLTDAVILKGMYDYAVNN